MIFILVIAVFIIYNSPANIIIQEMYLSVSVSEAVTLVPWTIIQQNEDITFCSLFLKIQSGVISTIPPTESLVNTELNQVFVGHNKDNFNVAESNHSVLDVCQMFGSFIKFLVSRIPDLDVETDIHHVSKRYKESTSGGIPATIKERNRKDSLYNELIMFCSTKNLQWQEPEKYGKPFLIDLCNTLWYIDGHHHVLKSRSCPIPSMFSQFVGFNKPELSKHRKRSISNMSQEKLTECALQLQEHAWSSWMQHTNWQSFRDDLLSLIESISSYSSYLQIRNKSMKLHHASTTPASFSDSTILKYINSNPVISPLLREVNNVIASSCCYQKICINDYCPIEKRRKYIFIRELEKGLSVPFFFFIHTHSCNYYFAWKAPEHLHEEASTIENVRIIEEIKQQIPTYHTRAMKREFFAMYGRISCSSKPYILRSIYRTLTGDESASRTTDEHILDQRIQEALQTEDPDIVLDLRKLNSNSSDNFTTFWSKCREFLSSCTTVHERRHGIITYMARAISVRDLIEQVRDICPENTPIPSESWVRYNFAPQNPHSKVAGLYRGRLEVKHMVQKRQFRKTHPDAHFCAALFRYMREFAIMFRDVSIFISMDDKHRINVGEPDFPIAAVERGKEVIVSLNEIFCVGDHDFSKFSLIPSVIFIVNIPTSMEESWYTGEVYVGIKDAVFEPSSAIRHVKELSNCLNIKMADRHMLFVYTDGGPDHRLTYVSVQLSLIALFLNMDLDVLVACRTAPCNSWANPVERIMSIINLGLQCVGVMRRKGGENFERCVATCNTLKDLRSKCNDFKSDVIDTLEPAKELISNVIKRLQLKGEKFQIFHSATDSEINSFWEILLNIESNLTKQDTTKKSLDKLPLLKQYIQHCCVFRKYSVMIRKCGKPNCTLCLPVKMPSDIFSRIHTLPDPCIGEDGHYVPFSSVYTQDQDTNLANEILHEAPSGTRKKIGFNVTQQHVKNVNLVVQCDECLMWRLLFSKKKLKHQSKEHLQNVLQDISYTCGATLEEISLPDDVDVYIKDHRCHDPVEKLYYSCGFEPICFFCSGKVDSDHLGDGKNYPQCSDCSLKAPVKRPKRSKKL